MVVDDHSQIVLSPDVALSFLNFHLISFRLSSSASPRKSKLSWLLRNSSPVPTLLEDTPWTMEDTVREEVVLPLPKSDCPAPSYFPLPISVQGHV